MCTYLPNSIAYLPNNYNKNNKKQIKKILLRGTFIQNNENNHKLKSKLNLKKNKLRRIMATQITSKLFN